MPESALSQPDHVKGLRLSLTIETPLADVPMNQIDNGAGPLEYALNTKRPELDYWLCKESGAAILDDCTFTSAGPQREKLLLKVKRAGKDGEIEAGYLVGADGSMSTVRKAVFPDFGHGVTLIPCYEEWYRGKIELEPGWLYAFYDRSLTGFMATVFHKDDRIIVTNGTTRGKPAKQYFHRFHVYLRERHGLQVEEISERHGSVLNDMAATRNYCLGKENMLMVGEAAGFIRGTEGIGPALLSGRIAGESILKSVETGRRASDFYAQAVGPVIESLYRKDTRQKRP